MRQLKREVKIGNVTIGGNNPIAVQTMLNVPVEDIEGNVAQAKRCEAAREAGAQFFLTPSATTGTMEFCRRYDIPLLPGVLTPTDVAVCLEYGYTIMKLFPAGDMPPSYIKSLKGPFDGTEYVAVGGVDAGNIKTFLDNGFIGVGIGSNLMPKEYVKNDAWDKASEYVKGIVGSI